MTAIASGEVVKSASINGDQVTVAEQAKQAEDDRAARRARVTEALHTKYTLTADQVIGDFSAYNRIHTNRQGEVVGGALEVRVTIAGHGVNGAAEYRSFDIDDRERGDLGEDIITDLGQFALESRPIERIITA